MESNIFIHLLLGPVMLVLSLLYKTFPPKDINFLYGYRTSRSMKSEHTWAASNKWSANMMVLMSLATCTTQAVLFAAGVSAGSNIGWSSAVLVALLLGHIPLIEMRLKKQFDDKGQPISF